MRLPGPGNALDAFDDMLKISKSLAAKLDAELRDEQGSTLSIQRERYMREDVIQFQHQVT
jgi:FtsZ-interacting cell division protein ZipA